MIPQNKHWPVVVKITINDDGDRVHNPKWCCVDYRGDAERTLCSGEVFGFGESGAEYEKKRGKITCANCIDLLKTYRATKL